MQPLQSFQIPVEIFIIFIERGDTLFCSKDIEIVMNNRFNLGISKQSVNKILKGLTETGRLVVDNRTKPDMNVKANYYRINPQIPDFPYKNIITRQRVTRKILEEIPPVVFLAKEELNGEVKEKNDQEQE